MFSTASLPTAQQLLLSPSQSLIRVSIEVPKTPRFILSFNKDSFKTVKQFIQYVCQQTGIDEKAKYLLMLDDAVIVNIESIRDNDRVTLVPGQNILEGGSAHHSGAPSYHSLLSATDLPSYPSLGTPLYRKPLNPESTQSIDLTTAQKDTDMDDQSNSGLYRQSWHMGLFKSIRSFHHRQISAQVKYAALQNGFKVLQENKEPLLGRDGQQKLFFCCFHQKPQKCPFRLQYVKRTVNEEYFFNKGRDMHNHDFVDPLILLKENTQNEQTSENTQLLQSLQQHFDNMNEGGLQRNGLEVIDRTQNAEYQPIKLEDELQVTTEIEQEIEYDYKWVQSVKQQKMITIVIEKKRKS
ncbi:hypothetical protein FGO68_gene12601 [Halteria grandinella]|uniref:Uncharacterized protein n=1 Tax=Halteria grandinella TaxID=5974 RepID=A0A8J8T0M1_HALGN|nr:hypothetical protein FGO68_gene12601 [Halteria grandinella]